MKMICDVPDEVIKSVRMGTWCGSSVAEKMIANGTPIPDNATNGDIMHGLYMPYGYVVNDDYDEVVISAEGVDMKFSKNWWNSPYQKGGK